MIKEVLEILGAKITFENHTMTIDSRDLNNWDAPYNYVQKMRASVLIMGPLLARLGKAKISMPGGCAIGTRPIDLHLKGLEALGADIQILMVTSPWIAFLPVTISLSKFLFPPSRSHSVLHILFRKRLIYTV